MGERDDGRSSELHRAARSETSEEFSRGERGDVDASDIHSADAAAAIIAGTTAELRRVRQHDLQLSLASGACGRLLMESVCASGLGRDSEYPPLLRQSVRRCIETLSHSRASPGLFSGAAGIGWTLLRVTRHVEDGQVVSACRAVSAALLRLLKEDGGASLGNDLIDGIAGLVVFAAEFARRTDDAALLERASRVLLRRAVESDNGYYWPSEPQHLPQVKRRRYPLGCRGFGVAHGQVGIASALSRAAVVLGSPALHRASTASLEWMLQSARGACERSYWPAIVHDSEEESVLRPGWCYGDIGACIVASAAAARLSRNETVLGFRLLLRQRLEVGVPWDALEDDSLCHGAAGALALLMPGVALSGWGFTEVTSHGLRLRVVEALLSRLSTWQDEMDARVSGVEDGLLMGTEGCIAAIAAAGARRQDDSPLVDLFVGEQP